MFTNWLLQPEEAGVSSGAKEYLPVEGRPVEGDAATHGLQDAVRLLVDLLLHEVVKPARSASTV